VPVHYCLGLGAKKFARAADPWDFEPLMAELARFTKSEARGRITRLPSFAWTEPGALSSHLIAHLTFADHDEATSFHASLRAGGLADGDYGFGSDPAISTMDTWSPIGPGGGIFGNRDIADELTGVAALRRARRDGKPVGTGEGVNVIIVDRGLDRNWVGDTIARMASRRGLSIDRPAPDVFGWTRYEWKVLPDGRQMRRSIFPGATGSNHAQMIARNVLAIAPAATIWDAPLLPLEEEEDAPPGPASAAHLFHWIKRAVMAKRVMSWDTRQNALVQINADKPWIMVNAWGVLDPETDPDLQSYADDPDNFLVNDMTRLASANIDVVFAAGNCGEPCPDRRCGSHDTGPGRSILGLNAHPDVLTVGAVRADGLPVALSAQGPGRLATMGSRRKNDYSSEKRAIEKPDLCAPSHFRESDDASELNTGTSAACGFAAGVLAALRSVPEGKDLSPQKMRDVLRNTAQHPAAAPGWEPRLGCGIINAEKALAYLYTMNR
jgi:hypothetical protein